MLYFKAPQNSKWCFVDDYYLFRKAEEGRMTEYLPVIIGSQIKGLLWSTV